MRFGAPFLYILVDISIRMCYYVYIREAVNVAGNTMRTNTVYKALRAVASMAVRCEERAEKWRSEFGEDDDMRLGELVRAEAYREAVLHMVEDLGLDAKELWPVMIVED